ncbi:MAG: cell division protein FtsA [Bacteroidales bacterium]|nr:cell division protein FtsA [Bacteroidales bacterium]
METERYIVAIDLGTTRTSLTVAKTDMGNIDIVFHESAPSAGVNRGSVQNPRNAAEVIRGLVSKAETDLDIKIEQAVVGYPKYYIREVTAEASMEIDASSEISEETIAALKDMAESKVQIEEIETIYASLSQSFGDNDSIGIREDDMVGRMSDYIEGNFKVFIGRKSHTDAIENVFNKVGICPIRKYFTPSTTAEAVLDASEMENGVALVDMGGGVTSVSVFLGGVLRHYASIPFGGRSVTYDVRSQCAIDDELAENIKKGFGVCLSDRLQSLSDRIIRIKSPSSERDSSKHIPVKLLPEIIEPRERESTDAILYEIEQSGCADELRCGLVITGGAVEMGGVNTLWQEMSGYNVRTGYARNRFSAECLDVRRTDITTNIGMILAAREEHNLNCARPASTVEKPLNNMFEPEPEPVKPEPEPEPVKREPVEKPRAAAKPKTEPKKKSGGFFGGLFEEMMNSDEQA